MESIGNLDLVPPRRRVGGPGATRPMAPFVQVSTDRPSRFSRGHFGVLYAGREFEAALLETVHHHARFMARTKEWAGRTSQLQEIVLEIDGHVHDLRGEKPGFAAVLPNDFSEARALASNLPRTGERHRLSVLPKHRFAGSGIRQRLPRQQEGAQPRRRRAAEPGHVGAPLAQRRNSDVGRPGQVAHRGARADYHMAKGRGLQVKMRIPSARYRLVDTSWRSLPTEVGAPP